MEGTKETTVAEAPTAPALSLPARLWGCLTSPRETFARIVERPAWLGPLIVVIAVQAALTGWFVTTDAGRNAAFDKSMQAMKAFSSLIPPEQMEKQREQLARTYKEGSGVGIAARTVIPIAILGPVVVIVEAGLLMLVFNALMGGSARFKQLLAIITHSSVVMMLSTIIVMPLNYFRESLDSATTLRVLAPMLDDGSFIARLLDNVDLFRIWWVLVLAIGLAVLYRRKTTPIAVSLFGVYAVFALVVASIAAMFAARS